MPHRSSATFAEPLDVRMLADANHLNTPELTLLLALTLRRAGQIWRRAERDTPNTWLSYADRIMPEFVGDGLKKSALGQAAQPLVAGRAEDKRVAGRQGIVIWADALAAGFDYQPGAYLNELETAELANRQLPAGFRVLVPATETPNLVLEWPLLSRSDVPEHSKGNADLKDAYVKLWNTLKSALEKLPADERLVPALKGVLELVAKVPVATASSRFVGMADHVAAALVLATTLERTLGHRIDDSPTQWADSKTPYWLAFGVTVQGGEAKTLSVNHLKAQAQIATEALNDLRRAIGQHLPGANLDLANLARPSSFSDLYLLELNAGPVLERVVNDHQAAWHSRGLSLGVSGMALCAQDFAGAEAVVGRKLAQVMTESATAAAKGSPRKGYAVFAPLARHAQPVELDFSPPGQADERKATQESTPQAFSKPTLVAASPLGTGSTGPTLLATATISADVVGYVALAAAPGVTAALPLPSVSVNWSEVVALIHHANDAMAEVNSALVSAVERHVEPCQWWVASPMSQVPELVQKATAAFLRAWHQHPPLPLASGLATATDDNLVAAGKRAWAVATRLTAQPTLTNKLGRHFAAIFPRHGDDVFRCVPISDLHTLTSQAHQLLGLCGAKLVAAGTRVEQVSRTYDWVPRHCLRVLGAVLPSQRGQWTSGGPTAHNKTPRQSRWRSLLAYALYRAGPRKLFSRKKIMPPSRVETILNQLTQAEPGGLDPLWIFELAARWVQAVLPNRGTTATPAKPKDAPTDSTDASDTPDADSILMEPADGESDPSSTSPPT